VLGAEPLPPLREDQPEAGSAPTHLWLLVGGEVALQDPGAAATGEPRFRLNPLAPIGELGAVTGTRRSTTAVTTPRPDPG
jgi:CRP/FNR family cyclic AMP-dependent transcriptional regulator